MKTSSQGSMLFQVRLNFASFTRMPDISANYRLCQSPYVSSFPTIFLLFISKSGRCDNLRFCLNLLISLTHTVVCASDSLSEHIYSQSFLVSHRFCVRGQLVSPVAGICTCRYLVDIVSSLTVAPCQPVVNRGRGPHG